MTMSRNKTLGVMGGMGPAATLDFVNKVNLLTNAKNDQQHIDMVVNMMCSTPDRTAALLGNGISPLPKLCESAESLLKQGAEVIAMPCNTAHYWHEKIVCKLEEKYSNFSFPNMVNLAVDAVRSEFADVDRVVILATEGAIYSQIYQDALSAAHVKFTVPEPDVQALVTKAIYGVKAENIEESRKFVNHALNGLVGTRDVLLLGCTELPLVVGRNEYPRQIDATLELAKEIVRLCKGEVERVVYANV